MATRSIWALGVGQLVNWGVLYYAFAVLLVPLEESLGVARWIVAGAFSTSLLVAAAAAPAVGRLADRGFGPAMLRAGGLIAGSVLCIWALAPSVFSTYVLWSALGLCMAAVLYEPVFVIVGRAFTDGSARLRAIATITVMGGLASTVFLPATSAMVDRWGWQVAVVILAAVIALTTLAVSRVAFGEPTSAVEVMHKPNEAVEGPHGGFAGVPGLRRFMTVFAFSSVVNSALSANLVAALIDRQLSSTSAAMIAGLFGILQLPGRIVMTNRAFLPRPSELLVFSFALQIAGLVALVPDSTTSLLWIGVVLFAGGAGLTTLARPYFVFHTYGSERAGVVNGAIARAQQIARAGAPVAAAALGAATGYGRVFAGLATLLTVAVFLTLKGRS